MLIPTNAKFYSLFPSLSIPTTRKINKPTTGRTLLVLNIKPISCNGLIKIKRQVTTKRLPSIAALRNSYRIKEPFYGYEHIQVLLSHRPPKCKCLINDLN